MHLRERTKPPVKEDSYQRSILKFKHTCLLEGVTNSDTRLLEGEAKSDRHLSKNDIMYQRPSRRHGLIVLEINGAKPKLK